MLVKPDAGLGLGQDVAHLERLAAQILAIELDQVEGVEEDARIVPPMPEQVKARPAVIAAGDRLTINDGRARAQAGHGLDDQREAVG
jgi:hypothetical protein